MTPHTSDAHMRKLAFLTAVVLIGAACSSSPDAPESTEAGAGSDDTPTEEVVSADDAPAAEDAPVEEDVPVEDEPVAEEEPVVEPTVLALSADPIGSIDPLETINHLESVLVWPGDDGLIIQFPAMENGGLRVEIQDEAQGVDAFCDLYMSDTLTAACTGHISATGMFLPQEARTIVEVDSGFAFSVPLTSDGTTATLTIGGVEYTGAPVYFSDAPGMVQINPDGSLASEVVRTIGIGSPADVAAAIG